MKSTLLDRHSAAVVLTLATAVTTACSSPSTPSGLGKQQLSVSGDTIVGSGQLAELQQRRAAWIARGIKNYRVELRISCFCAGDIRRPVLIEVQNGTVVKAWDLETAKAIADVSPYPSIEKLFDNAVTMASQGGHVSVAYDRALGFPARLEVGTIANDAGVLYYLGALTALGG
jgi:hypothetical protein